MKAPRKLSKPKITREEADRRQQAAEHAGALWVAAVSLRVRELAEELGYIDALLGNPDRRPAALVLKMVLDVGAVNQLISLVNEAEALLPRLLQSDVSDHVPDLAYACRRAAEGLSVPLEAE